MQPRPRQQAAVQLKRPLGRALPEPLRPRFGVVRDNRSIIEVMLEAEEAHRRQCFAFGKPQTVSTPAPRPAPPPNPAVQGVGRPEGMALPPRMPETLAELDKAMMLLSAWYKGHLQRQTRVGELVALVGRLPPSRDLAQTWKTNLKALRPKFT